MTGSRYEAKPKVNTTKADSWRLKHFFNRLWHGIQGDWHGWCQSIGSSYVSQRPIVKKIKRYQLQYSTVAVFWWFCSFSLSHSASVCIRRGSNKDRELNIIKGEASLTINPLIGGLFTCHKNPSAPSALRCPLNVLRRLMRFSSKARGSFEAGITPQGGLEVFAIF